MTPTSLMRTGRRRESTVSTATWASWKTHFWQNTSTRLSRDPEVDVRY